MTQCRSLPQGERFCCRVKIMARAWARSRGLGHILGQHLDAVLIGQSQSTPLGCRATQVPVMPAGKSAAHGKPELLFSMSQVRIAPRVTSFIREAHLRRRPCARDVDERASIGRRDLIKADAPVCSHSHDKPS